jgi:hypothetical protein
MRNYRLQMDQWLVQLKNMLMSILSMSLKPRLKLRFSDLECGDTPSGLSTSVWGGADCAMISLIMRSNIHILYQNLNCHNSFFDSVKTCSLAQKGTFTGREAKNMAKLSKNVGPPAEFSIYQEQALMILKFCYPKFAWIKIFVTDLLQWALTVKYTMNIVYFSGAILECPSMFANLAINEALLGT